MTGEPEWRIVPGLSPYAETVAAMEAHAAALLAGTAGEAVWLVEHPRVYTGGTSARDAELMGRDGVAVVRTGRGGRFTYHGPGQRVVYPILDLGTRGRDVRAYVHALEQWVIDALATLEVQAFRTADTGVWTDVGAAPAKIAAIGVRVRRWVAFHGFSVNVTTELADYGGIVPCGIVDRGVTSLQALGCAATMDDLDRALFGARAVLPARCHEAA